MRYICLIKAWNEVRSTYNTNYSLSSRRIGYDLPPKLFSKIDFNFKFDQSIMNCDEVQALIQSNQLSKSAKSYHTQGMTSCMQTLHHKQELLINGIKPTIARFPQDDDDGFDTESYCVIFNRWGLIVVKRVHMFCITFKSNSFF